MSWVAVAVVASAVIGAGNAEVQRKKGVKARKKAKKQADADLLAQQKAERFAEREGDGLGEIGQVSLAIDNEIDEEEELRKVTGRQI